MRYKELIQRKLDSISNQLSTVKHFASRNEYPQVNGLIEELKEEISNIQTLLNNEIQE